MAANSRIEWTTHTFNPWWGCVKVSAACRGCYAEALAKRYGHDVWGPGAARRLPGEAYWRQPARWDAAAAAAGVRHRVFCASMADVFEDRRDLDGQRDRLWSVVSATPNLDWLLLTKRPAAARRLVPWDGDWPANVWMGTTVEDQARAGERLPELARIPAAVRFVSAEPLLGPVALGPWARSVDWVIAGGETGAGARASGPSWFRALRDECLAAGIAFHFKQWGDWSPCAEGAGHARGRATSAADGTAMRRVGKKHAGRALDGRFWDGLPVPAAA